MAIYQVYLTGDRTPFDVQLYYPRLSDVLEDASRARFISGHMIEPDEDGVCREIMIPTGRIHCIIETGRDS